MSEGAPNNELEASSAGTVGANDLLIVGPGVLGRIIAEEWRKVITEKWTKYMMNILVCSAFSTG